ncbi:MAG: glutamate synthase [bacterium]
MNWAKKIITSRQNLIKAFPPPRAKKSEEEGGCGVTGFACSIPVSGKHIFEPSIQMHNRGNGKGGGIAAVGFSPDEMGVSQKILKEDYLLQIALLEPGAGQDIEDKFITPFFKVDKAERIPTIKDFRDLPSLEVKPPDVQRYFVRVKPDVLRDFITRNNLENMDLRRAEDEFIYQNSFKLNQKFYASLGEKAAFVLSQGRNMMILKIVGYAEDAVKYYQLENFKAHIWIAHQRYPTKGRVWHPGGAHPFCGMNEALVHNGDFANYHSVTEYLKQRGYHPLFLTDTEVSILVFDLLNRVYGYPLEYIIEALAPTTELDFDHLPEEKQRIYRLIQAHHIHGSPDGPWFFIIARNNPYEDYLQLIGITDTAMLRPQVFALYEGPSRPGEPSRPGGPSRPGEQIQIGLICSEKQAIDATLHSLAKEDPRFSLVADKYWNARGGSHTDGGAFIFTLKDGGLICTDKFGRRISAPPDQKYTDLTLEINTPPSATSIKERIKESAEAFGLFEYIKGEISHWDYNCFRWACDEMVKASFKEDSVKGTMIEALTLLNDLPYDTTDKKRSLILQIIREALHQIFSRTPYLNEKGDSLYRLIDWERRESLRKPKEREEVLIINASSFPPEGDDCDARVIVEAYALGWKRFMAYGYKGQRFCGCGLGPETKGVRIDVYGSSGDYLASGIDGLEIYVHNNAQDQLGQIMKAGKLVVYGDVGQTFMYGAKGGQVYVLGNAAGRPLINAVGKPRVVINGTCLDYLAESFMAGDSLKGGGFVILNGVMRDDKGRIREQPTPYPGSNLFSLASGGAIYLRDPHRKVVKEQLNGGEFVPLTKEDWEVILPYLKENERIFGISIEDDLLRVDGEKRRPEEVYRKVRAVKLSVLTEVASAEE